MLIVGTGDGAYSVEGVHPEIDRGVRKTPNMPRVERVMQFDATEGVFAATKGSLYHTLDGREWDDLGVPEETVYGVGVSPSEDVIYAGTRPPYLYTASIPEDIRDFRSLQWQELCGFRDLTSRDEWGVPRHNNVAQVRDICVSSETSTRLIVGVEPGGVHVSRDGDKTWQERRDGVHDDIHALNVLAMASPSLLQEWAYIKRRMVANRGIGWTQMLISSTSVQCVGTMAPSIRLLHVYRQTDGEASDADPALFESRDRATLERVESPCDDEVVVGWTVEADAPLGVTHRRTLLREETKAWKIVGAVPSPDTLHVVSEISYDMGRSDQ